MVSMGPLSPGNTLQNRRYTIIEKVGQGGMGYVYKASDNFNGGHIVAIKELRQDVVKPEDMQKEYQHFQKEAKTLQQLSPHPHIPQYYASFEEQKRYFIVMEFIGGDTLQTKVDSIPTNHLPVEQVLNYSIQICNTLAYLHQQSPPIILRDLKPANLKVTDDGRVYLLDFGIAREYKPEKIYDTTIRFTAGFTAPEILWEQTEPRSDLYSLGAVLYYCLTGHTPHENSSFPFNVQFVPNIKPLNIRPVRDFNANVPPELDSLIQRLLGFLKEERPSSAKVVSKELYAIRNGDSVATQPLPSIPTSLLRPFVYNLKTRAIQLISGPRSNTMRGLPALYLAKLLLFCSAVGSWMEFRLLPAIASCWHNLRQFASHIRLHLSARRNQSQTVQIPAPPPTVPPTPTTPATPTAQQSSQRNRLVKVILDNSATIAHELGRRKTTGQQTEVSPNFAPFVGVFVIIVCGTIGMLAVLHLSPYAVLFILAVLLLLVSFSASIQRTIDGQVQHILVAVMVAALLSCLALAYLPDMKHVLASITVNLLLLLLVIDFILLLSWYRHRASLVIKTLASAGIGITCILLPDTLWSNNTELAPLSLNTYLIPALVWIVTITLLLLTISVWLQLYPSFIKLIDRIMCILGYATLTLSGMLCVFFFLAYGNQLPVLNYSLPIQGVQVTIGQLVMGFMAVMTGIAFIRLIVFFCQLLRLRPNPGGGQAKPIAPWEGRRNWMEIWHRTGIFFDGWLLTALLFSLLFITWSTGGWQRYTYPVLPTMLTQIYTHLPLPLWLAECGLLLAAGFSFFHLQLHFENVKHATIRLLFVLALICKTFATACIILLAIGAWPTIIALLFASLEIVCLILLIQMVLLIAWAEKERLERES